MLTPTLAEFIDCDARGKRVPLRRRIPADLETPVSAFLKLRGAGTPGGSFLLESVEQGIQVGRYSFIGVTPHATLKLVGDSVEITRAGERETHTVDGNPLGFVRAELARTPEIDDTNIPGPLAGAVGYLSYDIARYFENVPLPPGAGLGLPDFFFVVPRTLVVFDHVRCEIEIVALPREGDAKRAYEAARADIDSLLDALASPLPLEANGGRDPVRAVPEANLSREVYETLVARAKEHILAGDAFQIVLSQRLGARTSAAPFQVYRSLRILNPSPYMFFFDFEEFQIVGSSPEVLVKLEDGQATMAPIAGTRPRGETPVEDQRLETELLADEKERAEHVMLVDLGRNDLGRVCDPGTVTTDSFMHIERYSHVMHIVSTVTGRLRQGLDAFDLLRATFPAGTVSGAPKIRAMEIVSELERDRRGPYAGALGYFGHNGNMDMCITIRSIIMIGERYHVQAGAGIVADSDPSREYDETLSKIRGMTRAISIAEEGF